VSPEKETAKLALSLNEVLNELADHAEKGGLLAEGSGVWDRDEPKPEQLLLLSCSLLELQRAAIKTAFAAKKLKKAVDNLRTEASDDPR